MNYNEIKFVLIYCLNNLIVIIIPLICVQNMFEKFVKVSINYILRCVYVNFILLTYFNSKKILKFFPY